MGTNAGCGSRTSCPLDGGCSSIFLVFIRRRNPPTGAPTVVLATRWCAERREGADDASARLAAVFRLSGSRNPAAAGRAPPLRFVPRANRSQVPRASATASQRPSSLSNSYRAEAKQEEERHKRSAVPVSCPLPRTRPASGAIMHPCAPPISPDPRPASSSLRSRAHHVAPLWL